MPSEGVESGTLLLYGAATSSCSFRVRIALNLLDLKYRNETVDAAKRYSADFRQLNPQGLVPLLVHDNRRVSQSIAIIEYLQDVFGGQTTESLLPKDPLEKARVRGLALYVCCEVQPIQNTRLDSSLAEAGVDILSFKQHWIGVGLQALERALDHPQTGTFCHGNHPTLADCCLVPQVWNALNRYGLSLDSYPRVQAVYDACLQLPMIQKALPENQPDFTPPTN